MSPKTKLLAFAVFIAVVVTLLFNLMDIPFRPGYASALILTAIAVVIYILLTRIAERLRQRKLSP